MNYPIRFKPTKKYVETLGVGNLALDPYGRLSKVVSVDYKGQDIHGKSYVGVSLYQGKSSTISHSFKEGELVLTTALTARYNNQECLDIGAQRKEDDHLPLGVNNNYVELFGKVFWKEGV